MAGVLLVVVALLPAATPELTDPVPYDGAVDPLSERWIIAFAGLGIVGGLLLLLVRGLGGYRSHLRVADIVDLVDRLDRGRRGPRQRRRRAGRDDPRLAPPEPPVRLLPGDGR